MNYTTNYDLPQWEAGDRVKRADMNGAMAAIDAALGALGGGDYTFETYTYVGTGTYGQGNETTLTFSAQPAAFFVIGGGTLVAGFRWDLMSFHTTTTTISSTQPPHTWTGSTLTFYSTNPDLQANARVTTYRVIAWVPKT